MRREALLAGAKRAIMTVLGPSVPLAPRFTPLDANE